LVRTIANEKKLSPEELDRIEGSGLNGRLTKEDLSRHLAAPAGSAQAASPKPNVPATGKATPAGTGSYEIVEMDRMRKLIAEHMVGSVQTSPHVTSFTDVDMTPIMNWRKRHKDEFQKKYGQKLTFMPFFIDAMARAVRDFPMINASVDGDKILVKKDVNIGMAAALPNGNLIVPVVKAADQMNLAGLASQVNDLASRARENKLLPDEIQGGTITLTNVGSFGNTSGTPIINQPQVAILAIGAIRKKPAVIETPEGDTVGIRHMMVLSLSYDHRVVDGALGGSYLQKVASYLEAFDTSMSL
jgi:2-oxoglutarate dehydrogenase E2 component (dihydrolipoamide succinyltransferase)